MRPSLFTSSGRVGTSVSTHSRTSDLAVDGTPVQRRCGLRLPLMPHVLRRIRRAESEHLRDALALNETRRHQVHGEYSPVRVCVDSAMTPCGGRQASGTLTRASLSRCKPVSDSSSRPSHRRAFRPPAPARDHDRRAGRRSRSTRRGPAARRRTASVVGVVCHPHPLHAGTMQNKVVHTAARALQEAGAATVRFNFRGVGAQRRTL